MFVDFNNLKYEKKNYFMIQSTVYIIFATPNKLPVDACELGLVGNTPSVEFIGFLFICTISFSAGWSPKENFR
jgi:hypothetical protein